MKLLAILASILMLSSMSFAADAVDAGSTTVDHSKNPITGTEKTVKKTKVHEKGANGEVKETVKETTTKDKHGKVEKKTEVEGKADQHN